ncbi:hypothetical protein GCM10028824_35850 [Hymenobacter segetis]|uniref:HNH endonuclease n=1 Tax=Hymenobacter segetis TaxID=2025509 RepID=A0ABU9LYF8_9BACT
MNNCLHCGIATANPKYCSRSHAAIHTNQQAPKRQLTRKCQECDTLIPGSRQFCAVHGKRKADYRLLTVAQLKAKDAIKHPSYYRGYLNSITRLLNAHRPRTCQAYGYDKHVEYCHIQPISAFPDSVMVQEVSGPENILVLCPNCHWEYDHSLSAINPALPSQ